MSSPDDGLENKKKKEEFKAFLAELPIQEKKRKREGQQMKDNADLYIVELERRKIEEELNIGSQEYSIGKA